jgi:hypothetical protein
MLSSKVKCHESIVTGLVDPFANMEHPIAGGIIMVGVESVSAFEQNLEAISLVSIGCIG